MAYDADQAAVAYGEFHLAFAALDTELRRALVVLDRPADFTAEFSRTKLWPFGKRVGELRKRMSTIQRGIFREKVAAILAALVTAEKVAGWRNERIHGEVWFVENRIALLGDDGKPLTIDLTDCAEMRRRAIFALSAIQVNVSRIVGELNLEDRRSEHQNRADQAAKEEREQTSAQKPASNIVYPKFNGH